MWPSFYSLSLAHFFLKVMLWDPMSITGKYIYKLTDTLPSPQYVLICTWIPEHHLGKPQKAYCSRLAQDPWQARAFRTCSWVLFLTLRCYTLAVEINNKRSCLSKRMSFKASFLLHSSQNIRVWFSSHGYHHLRTNVDSVAAKNSKLLDIAFGVECSVDR